MTLLTANGEAGRTFAPYGDAFTGGIRTATADLTGDELARFLALDPAFLGGVFIS